jgi:hypothetical protein
MSLIVNVSKRSFGAYTRPDVLIQKQPSKCLLVHSFLSKCEIVIMEGLNTVIVTKLNEPAKSKSSI